MSQLQNQNIGYGLRKNNSIKALHKLNEKYSLGLINIEDLSTSQLKRKIFEIRQEKGLSINRTHRLLTKRRYNRS